MQDSFHQTEIAGQAATGSEAAREAEMRAEFWAWVHDQGCDTDGAWSAWQGAWTALIDDAKRYRFLKRKGEAAVAYLALMPTSANWDEAIDRVRLSPENNPTRSRK